MPKHFVRLVGGKSLFEINYEALRQAFEPGDIYVQTNQQQAQIARKLAPEIAEENYFIEPEMRNHGPAMGLMAAKLYKICPDEPYMIVQADVIRKPADKFLEMIRVMEKLIRKEGRLMTGGVRLDRVVGGIDFMLPGEDLAGVEGMRVFKMKRWVDRNDKDRDDKGIAGGRVYGHANHYAWTPRAMLEAYKRRAPEWYEPLVKMLEAMGTQEEDRVIREEYAKMPADPIEARVTKYELNDALVVECPFEWIDLGTWESVCQFLANSKSQTNLMDLVEIGGEGNWVRSRKFTAVVGLSDVVVVETEDALLVCKKSESGRVGEVVTWLREKERRELL